MNLAWLVVAAAVEQSGVEKVHSHSTPISVDAAGGLEGIKELEGTAVASFIEGEFAMKKLAEQMRDQGENVAMPKLKTAWVEMETKAGETTQSMQSKLGIAMTQFSAKAHATAHVAVREVIASLKTNDPVGAILFAVVGIVLGLGIGLSWRFWLSTPPKVPIVLHRRDARLAQKHMEAVHRGACTPGGAHVLLHIARIEKKLSTPEC